MSNHDTLEQLKSRVRRYVVQEKKIDEKVLELVRMACQDALEQVLLSRVERDRLVQQLVRDILLEILAKS